MTSEEAVKRSSSSEVQPSIERRKGKGFLNSFHTRTLFFAFLVGLYYSIWCLATLVNTNSNVARPYDPNTIGYISLAIQGCDIRFTQGVVPELRYHALFAVSSLEWSLVPGSALGTVSSVRAGNRWNCKDVPTLRCAHYCELIVSVPPSAISARFEVKQVTGDESNPRIEVEPEVSFRELYVESHNANINVRGATISKVYVQQKDGFNEFAQSTIGSLSVYASGDGTIHVRDAPSQGQDASVTYRQPGGHYCIASNAPTASFVRTPASSAPGCDMSAIQQGTGATNYWFAPPSTIVRYVPQLSDFPPIGSH